MTDRNWPDESESSHPMLQCGRDPVEVIDRAHAGRSSTHEQSCAHCQDAIDTDGIARTATLELAEAERQRPAPATMLPNIMRSVWSDLRRTATIPLSTATGSAFVADHTVAAVIEYALDQLTDLQIHTCDAHLVATDDHPASATAAAGTIAIEVTAAAAYNADVRAAATEARDIVHRTVVEQFGWRAEPIDITIVDVYLPDGAQLPENIR